MSTRGQKARASPEEPREKGELWRALEAGLQEILPGLTVLDRDLVFDEGGRADLAAADATGRLILVLLAEDLDRTALEALDALSFARRHATLLAHHFKGRVEAELEPRIVVVTPAVDERLTLRLAPLLGSGLELFGVRTLASRSGERSYLVPLEPAEASPGLARVHGEEAFLEALPSDLRGLAADALERLGRLDDELELLATRDALSWRFRGEVLVRIERAGNLLRASVSPHEERHPLDGGPALEDLLERALGRLVSLLGPRGGEGGDAEGDPGTTPRALLEKGEPLLSPEEIEAFRD